MANTNASGTLKILGYLFIVCGIICVALCLIAVVMKFLPSFSSGIADVPSYLIKVISFGIIGAFLIVLGRMALQSRLRQYVIVMTVVLVLGIAGLVSSVLHPEAAEDVGAFAYNAQMITCIPGILLPAAGLLYTGITNPRIRRK
jgi:hypothetical protein